MGLAVVLALGAAVTAQGQPGTERHCPTEEASEVAAGGDLAHLAHDPIECKRLHRRLLSASDRLPSGPPDRRLYPEMGEASRQFAATRRNCAVGHRRERRPTRVPNTWMTGALD